MDKVIKGKDISFNELDLKFSKEECYYVKQRQCPIQGRNLSEIPKMISKIKEKQPNLDVYKDTELRSERIYCICLVNSWLVENINLVCADITVSEEGYIFDGRHRLCIANKLGVFDDLDIVLAQ